MARRNFEGHEVERDRSKQSYRLKLAISKVRIQCASIHNLSLSYPSIYNYLDAIP